MAYVYQKTAEYTKANHEYKEIMAEKPDDLVTEKKLIDNLYLLRDPIYIEASKHYYQRKKDYEIVRRIIDGLKAKEEFTQALDWLKIAYEDFEKDDDLKEIISISSFVSDKETQISYLKKQYALTDDTNILFTLYGLQDKEFALNTLVELLDDGKLTSNDFLKTIQFLIFDKRLKKAYSIYKKTPLKSLEAQKYEDSYVYLLETQQDFSGLKNFYLFLYKTTKKDDYYTKYTDTLLNEGDIKEFLRVAKKRYEKRKDAATLERLIQYNFLNDEVIEYLKYLGEKTVLDKDIDTAESIIAFYIDLNEIERLKKFLREINTISEDFDDFKDLSIQTLVYLEEYGEAEEIILHYSPKELNPDVIYSVFEQKINEKSMPYFMEILKGSRDQGTKAKLFRYRYKTLQLFTEETYASFGKPTTFGRLYSFLEDFPEKDQIKNFLRFAEPSNDSIFITDIAEYLFSIGDLQNAQRLFEKSLTINENDLLAIKHLGILNSWKSNLDVALSYFNRYTSKSDKDAEVDYYLGNIYFAKENKAQYTHHYQVVVNELKIENELHELMYLRSQSRLTDPMKLTERLDALIMASGNDENTIADVWGLYLEKSHYKYLLNAFKEFKEELNASNRLQLIEVNTYIQLNKTDIAKEKLSKLTKTAKSDVELAHIYESLGNLYFNTQDKKNALLYYNKSLKINGANEYLTDVRDEVHKDFRTKVTMGIGVRSQIKQVQLEIRETIEQFKLYVRNDTYDDYNSPKVEVSDINETLFIGIGKNYGLLEARNIASTGIGIFAKKTVDTGSETTVRDKLIYDEIGFSYSKDFKSLFTFNTKASEFKYDNFKRKRVEASIYVPIHATYFVNFAHIYEEVDGINNYGYVNQSINSLSVGESDIINKNFSYYYTLGTEYKEGSGSFFANADLIYKDKDKDISFQNSFSKDSLTNEYNFTSMIFFSYYF